MFSVQPAIDPTTGNLTYTPAPNVSGVAHISAHLHDDGGTANGGVDTSAVQVFTINVNFVNHATSFASGGDQNVNQDSGTHVVPGWASSISPGPGVDEQTQSLNFIVTNNDNPSLFSLQPTISANGTLTYALKPGVVGTANVTVVLHDNGGTANNGVDTSAPLTFAINVQHVNHAPTIVAPLQNQTVNEDAADVVLSLTGVFEDADTAIYGDVLTYSIGSNDNTSLLDASIANGVVTLHLKPNQNGIAHVAVRATDQALAATDDVITVTVQPVNDPPSFTAGPAQLVNVNAGLVTAPNWATNINPGPNESGQSVSFDVTNDNPSLFFVQPAIQRRRNVDVHLVSRQLWLGARHRPSTRQRRHGQRRR